MIDEAILGDVGASTPHAWVTALFGLLERDLRVLRRNMFDFLGRTVLQPLFFVFVFLYVFPHVGQTFSSQEGVNFATLVLPGSVSFAAMFAGVFAVGIPLSVDLGMSREIEDRASSPLPRWLLVGEKVFCGAVESWIAAALVFPLYFLFPEQRAQVSLASAWQLALLLLLIGVVSAGLGLCVGSFVLPTRLGAVFSILPVPLFFLGCNYYPWAALSSIPWLQVAVLVNPLVYVCEGLRATLTPQVPHMSFVATIAALTGFSVFFIWTGGRRFIRRLAE